MGARNRVSVCSKNETEWKKVFCLLICVCELWERGWSCTKSNKRKAVEARGQWIFLQKGLAYTFWYRLATMLLHVFLFRLLLWLVKRHIHINTRRIWQKLNECSVRVKSGCFHFAPILKHAKCARPYSNRSLLPLK